MSMNDERAATRADVERAYEVMLGRPPESEEAYASHLVARPTAKMLIRNLSTSAEFAARVGNEVPAPSPFLHFNASVDVKAIVESHIRADRAPRDGHYVNFLNVAVPVDVMEHTRDKSGQLDPVPIPANYHADMAEWAAALRAVDLARGKFVMIELGCGWGCWMNNTGVAAKSRGLDVHVIGVEGDEHHMQLAREALAVNGIAPDEYTLVRGVAAAGPGFALFPLWDEDDARWGSEPRFGVSKAESDAAVASGKFESLQMVPLAEAIGDHRRVDLLHMDIQGGEAELVKQTVPLLNERFAYIVIGTHSRIIEGQLLETLLDAGWKLEIERPAIFRVVDGRPQTTVDGVQGWRNPKFAA